jgi:hypothetical protein
MDTNATLATTLSALLLIVYWTFKGSIRKFYSGHFSHPKKDIGIQKMEKTPFGQKVSVI